MICVPCRNKDHDGCPEVARQKDPDLTDTDKRGSSPCYCGHQEGSVLRPDRKADPRRGA